VVKLGGSCVTDLPGSWWDDLARHAENCRPLLVHGWSEPLRRYDPRHGRPDAFLTDRFGNRSRWTTDQVIDDIMTVSANIGLQITDRLHTRGVATTRLLGSDRLLSTGPGERWWWRDRQLVELDNRVGPITAVDDQILHESAAVGEGCLLVTPLARDAGGRVVNTDADRAAAALAAAAKATVLVLVTNVPHLLIDGAPVRELNTETARKYRDSVVTGGMRKKLRAATEALEAGVSSVVLGNGTISDMLSADTGTMITCH
jgi:acetylglutamate kinase/acetylglutamate/LysW-gamma-L-alpha-aminoadipate kinase